MNQSFRFAFMAIVTGLLLTGRAQAARLLHATIERNGSLVQRSMYQDNGLGGPPELCRMLGQAPLNLGDPSSIKPAADDPLKARLDGKIVIQVKHVDKALLTATLENLNLVRDNAQDERWRLPPEEVQRAAQAAGINLNLAAFDPPATGAWVSMAAFVIIAVVLGVVLSRWRTPAASD